MITAADTPEVTAERRRVLFEATKPRWRWNPWAVQPCGTPAAYRRHLRHGEKPCQPCRDAHARRKQCRPKAKAGQP